MSPRSVSPFSLQNRKRGRRGDAQNSDLRRTEARREAAVRFRSSMALSNVLETPSAGFNFDNAARYELLFMSSEQQTVAIMTGNKMKSSVTLSVHRDQK